MSDSHVTIILCLVALTVSFLVYPWVLRFAVRHNIVDNPDARKLQRYPVPVMGGVVVFVGIVLSVAVGWFALDVHEAVFTLVAMTVMLLVGTFDDIFGLGVGLRFSVEVVVVAALIWFTGFSIDDFHGFLGIGRVSPYLWWPLSIVAGVGIINATNLIDGVDGYSSGYGIMSCSLFAVFFFVTGQIHMAMFALIITAALIPFFMHNVFGKTSKMFIGDGGTLMLGTALATFLFCLLGSHGVGDCGNRCVNPVAFSLAVLAVPVFDTLRVMGNRLRRGRSPFHPDKTHLHHLFIDIGFSHVGTAVTILMLNFAVVAACWLAWRLGASATWQVFIAIVLGILITFVFYKVARSEESKDSRFYRFLCRLARISHVERKGLWFTLMLLMDGKWREGNIISDVKQQVRQYDVAALKAELEKSFDPQERDRRLIQTYLEGKTNVLLDDIILYSGAEKLRVYPLVYQMVIDGSVTVLKENELGQINRVKMK